MASSQPGESRIQWSFPAALVMVALVLLALSASASASANSASPDLVAAGRPPTAASATVPPPGSATGPTTSPTTAPQKPTRTSGAPKWLTFLIGGGLIAAFIIPIFMLAARGRRPE